LALAVTSEAEAAPVSDLDLLLVPDLASLVAHLRGEASLPRGPARASLFDAPHPATVVDATEPSSWSSLALELMLAGGHHLLVLTDSLLLNEHELAAQLAPLTLDDAIELTTIHDLLTPTRLLRSPCVRRPSVHASASELFGSAHPIRPGEVSLADHGVLVLDDLHQFAHQTTLRQVLEDRSITHDGAHFPARFRLLATSPCTSDLAPSLLDRFDLVVRAGTIPIDPTAAQRIELARARQRSRLAATPWSCNAEIPRFGEASHRLCRTAAGRPDPRVARVARTLADLDPNRDPAEPLDADLLALAERLTLEAR
jgi:magnesium chelatase family protein